MNTFDPNHRYSDAAKLARLKNKKLFLFDIDGTIAVGDTLYEGSADLIRYINDIGGRAYYITNNSTKSGLDYVKKSMMRFTWTARRISSSPPAI